VVSAGLPYGTIYLPRNGPGCDRISGDVAAKRVVNDPTSALIQNKVAITPQIAAKKEPKVPNKLFIPSTSGGDEQTKSQGNQRMHTSHNNSRMKASSKDRDVLLVQDPL
jgi:hypothetical protein